MDITRTEPGNCIQKAKVGSIILSNLTYQVDRALILIDNLDNLHPILKQSNPQINDKNEIEKTYPEYFHLLNTQIVQLTSLLDRVEAIIDRCEL